LALAAAPHGRFFLRTSDADVFLGVRQADAIEARYSQL